MSRQIQSLREVDTISITLFYNQVINKDLIRPKEIKKVAALFWDKIINNRLFDLYCDDHLYEKLKESSQIYESEILIRINNTNSQENSTDPIIKLIYQLSMETFYLVSRISLLDILDYEFLNKRFFKVFSICKIENLKCPGVEIDELEAFDLINDMELCFPDTNPGSLICEGEYKSIDLKCIGNCSEKIQSHFLNAQNTIIEDLNSNKIVNFELFMGISLLIVSLLAIIYGLKKIFNRKYKNYDQLIIE